MNRRCKFKVIFFTLTASLIIVALLIYFHDFKPEFTEVYAESSDGAIKENSPYWICLKDPDYQGFFAVGFLEQYNVEYNDWDFEHYTYIVTFGYEMKNIEYSFSDCKNWEFSILPENYLGKLTLANEKTDIIHIYKLKKVDIESAFPDGPDDILFQN